MEDRILHQLSREDIVEEAMANDVLDIRPGTSICIHVHDVESSEEIIKKKFTTLIERAEMGDDVTVEVEVYKMAPNSFFGEYFPKTTPRYPKTPCSRCLRQTVIENEELILRQIESDIIEEILARSENVSDYIKNVCRSKNKPRVVRAKRFLMYVLQNQNALHTFFEVGKTRGLFDPNISECKECQNADKKSWPSDTTSQEPLFCFTKSSGKVPVKREDEEEKTNPDDEFEHNYWNVKKDKMPDSEDNTQCLDISSSCDDFSRSKEGSGIDNYMNNEPYGGSLLSIT